MLATIRVCLCAAVLAVGAQGAEVTPMEKVIRLLKELSAKVAEEGQRDAAQYDKYSCFCKAEADGKLYAIERSDKTIASLKAKITALTTSIAELNSDISDLSKQITGLEEDIKNKNEHRAQEHAEYQAKAKDMMEAIEACAAAIEALKNSKTEMRGAKLDFAQVQKATQGLVASVTKQMLISADPRSVALLEEMHGKAAPKFEYQSNDIIATLQELQASFKSMKANLDESEFKTQAEHDSDVLGLTNEKKFAEKDKAEKETIAASQEEDKEAAEADRTQEQKDRNADQSFLDTLTADCQKKAEIFDQRSKLRAQELTTLAEATAELEKGAVANYQANKKLVDLQKKPAVVKKAAISPKTLSFLQINNVQYADARKQLALEKVLLLLNTKAAQTGSSTLANIAMRAKLSEDHFVKVRALINDIIARLKADAEAEATTKSFCDQAMKKAITTRDDANHNIEASHAKITTLQARIEQLKSWIAESTAEIAALKKGLAEANEIYNEQSKENAKTYKMCTEGGDAVQFALKLLQKFYGDTATALVQKYVPPNSDREGNTVGDLAPEAFDAKYHGAQEESKGIIGILEVIWSDFSRQREQANTDEEEATQAIMDIEMATQMEIGEHEASIGTNQGLLAEAEGDLLEAQGQMGDANKNLASSEDKLSGLQKMCVEGEETWEERTKKREEEIEALKDALNILENWQS